MPDKDKEKKAMEEAALIAAGEAELKELRAAKASDMSVA